MEHQTIIIIYGYKKSQDHREIDGKGPQQFPILFHFSTLFPFTMDICLAFSERSPVLLPWIMLDIWLLQRLTQKCIRNLSVSPRAASPLSCEPKLPLAFFCVTVSVEQLLQDVSWQLLLMHAIIYCAVSLGRTSTSNRSGILSAISTCLRKILPLHVNLLS